jgi:hypothetical protein
MLKQFKYKILELTLREQNRAHSLKVSPIQKIKGHVTHKHNMLKLRFPPSKFFLSQSILLIHELKEPGSRLAAWFPRCLLSIV